MDLEMAPQTIGIAQNGLENGGLCAFSSQKRLGLKLEQL